MNSLCTLACTSSILQEPSDDVPELKEMAAMLIMMGEPSDDSLTYSKTSSLQVGQTFSPTILAGVGGDSESG